MDDAKIRLSAEEVALVTSSDWILTKNGILEKVKSLLGKLQEREAAFLLPLLHRLPASVRASSPKISKGENYRGLPYLVLDWPRDFGKDGVFAIRTLFWWGHYFTVTLHLSGKHKTMLAPAISAQHDKLVSGNWHIGVNDDEWEHHLGRDNYLPVTSLTEVQFRDIVMQSSFIKITFALSLDQWDDAENKLAGAFEFLVTLVT